MSSCRLSLGLIAVALTVGLSNTRARRTAAQPAGRDDRAHHGSRPLPRGQPRRRLSRSPGDRVSASELREGDLAPLSGAVLPSRLHGDGGGLREGARSSNLGRSRGGGGRSRNDRRASRCLHEVQRQHVLQFADDRRLGDVHRAGSAGVHRQAIPHHRVKRQPRTGRALDGRIRHDASGNEAACVVCRALCNELVLPDERPGGRPRCRSAR